MYSDSKDEVVQLHLDDIIPNRFQPREIFDEKALKELAVSIKEHGVIQPIIVRNVNGKYEIIAGERRYKASALAGLTKIPAIIRDLDDKESSKVALLENLQRKNLNPIEEARTYQKILEIDEMTQEELAKTMGKSQSAVANKIRLLSLPEEIQSALLKEQISERHARTLLNIKDVKQQKDMLKKIIENKMSVRSLEAEIKKINQDNDEEESDEAPLPPSDLIPSTSAFVNNNPLSPTAKIEEEEEESSNYGKIKISPPDGESFPETKFINYGEINDDEDDDNDEENVPKTKSSTEVNVEDIKENTSDLNSQLPGTADLDNLLNINSSQNGQSDLNFITPAERIVKTDSIEKPKSSEDYFQTPDLSSIIPLATDNNTSEDSDKKYSIEEATNKIRDLVDNLKTHGIKINKDEMNFEKSYQIILKIDKTNQEK